VTPQPLPLLLFLWLLDLGSLSAQALPVPGNFCLDQREAALGEARLGTPGAELLHAFGRPIQRSDRTGRDGAGSYRVQRLVFAHLAADLGRDERVERLATSDSAAAMPSGIHVGLSWGQILPRMGLPAAAALPERTWRPRFCRRGPLDPDRATITLEFDLPDPQRSAAEGPHLRRIEMTAIGP
jgi:hypothetical protein